ncbi:histone H3.3 type c-like [Eurosta solidaginis]|uniref:histone H3.3 type c-like n=1 Tax=Eurosta solidaginis TaxID=178769 RepID=UPI003530C95A
MRPTKKPRAKKLQKQVQSKPVEIEQPLQQIQDKQPRGNLGDTDTSSSADQELATDDHGFHSPPPNTSGTDYNLEFTDTGTRYLEQTLKEDQCSATANTIAQKQNEKRNDNMKPKEATNTKIPVPSKSASIPVANTNTAKAIVTAGASKRVMQKRQAQRDLKYFKNYRKLVARVDHMIPRAAFGRLVREIMLGLGTDVQYVTVTALEALQTATEAYVQGRLEDANLLALHARRRTLMAKDMELIHFLRTNQR